jgi:hypothetical protein
MPGYLVVQCPTCRHAHPTRADPEKGKFYHCGRSWPVKAHLLGQVPPEAPAQKAKPAGTKPPGKGSAQKAEAETPAGEFVDLEVG